MGYLIFAVVMAVILIAFLALKDRISRSPGRSVDAFRKAITALTPEEEAKRDREKPDAAGKGDAGPETRKGRP